MHARVSDEATEGTSKECLLLVTEAVKLLPDFAVRYGMVAMRVYDIHKREAKQCMHRDCKVARVCCKSHAPDQGPLIHTDLITRCQIAWPSAQHSQPSGASCCLIACRQVNAAACAWVGPGPN